MNTLNINKSYRWFRNIGTWILFLLVSGCSGSSTSPEEEQVEPGAFSITRIQSASKADEVAGKHTLGQTATAIDLGEVKNTADFFFVLTNAGDTDIEDITIDVTHPGFQLSPKGLDNLPPLEQLAVNQVLKLTVVHGTSPSGVGNAPLLEPGNALSEMNITGKTTDAEGDTLEVELVVDLTAEIKLTDVRFYRSSGSEIKLESPSGSVRTSRLYAGGSLRRYDVSPGEITVENTGNERVTITTYGYYYPAYEQLQTFQLAGGRSKVVKWPEFFLADIEDLIHSEVASNHIRLATGFHFKIEIGNTITDQDRLPVQDDGKVYIVLRKN